MKKLLIRIAILLLSVSMVVGFSIGCKTTTATTTAAETTAAVETTAAAETTAEAVVAGETLKFTHINASDPADPFISKISIGWKEACEKLGVTSDEQFAYADLAKMIDYTNAAIAANVDGIYIFNSLDGEALHPSIQAAVEKGIAVALTSTRDPVYGPNEVTFCGFDIEEQGHILGVWLAEQLKASQTVKDVKVAFMAEFNAPYSQQRSAGILRAFDEAGITYIASEIYEVGIDLGVAIDKTKSYMLANTDTNCLLGLGSLSSPSTVMVLQELGYEAGEIKWCGFDLAPEVVTGIQAGYGASNVDEVFNYGFLPAMALYLRAKYDFVVGDLPIATVMVDPSNIEDFLFWVEKGIK